MIRQLSILFLCSQFSFAQIYTNNAHLKVQKVFGQWRSGAIITEAGKTLEGEFRGFSYKANDVSSFRFRKEKGAETVTYKADDCNKVVYDGLNIISLPKNLKKPNGKRRFYVAMTPLTQDSNRVA